MCSAVVGRAHRLRRSRSTRATRCYRTFASGTVLRPRSCSFRSACRSRSFTSAVSACGSDVRIGGVPRDGGGGTREAGGGKRWAGGERRGPRTVKRRGQTGSTDELG